MDQQTTELFQKLCNGDRIALSRAITLIESQQSIHLAQANALLDACTVLDVKPAMRIAITGAPGVGKSTLIEAMSSSILNAGHHLAVLAIDPSSQITGGSILGDKTRMQSLASHAKAYVRPSPAGNTAGGVAERTREAVMLCEAAGFDVIIIETLGVGQSETQVRTMADLLALIITPGGGDEVQGIKRGILELTDLVIVNKADGAMKKGAQETKAQYSHALRVLHAQGSVPAILTCSASEGTGVQDVWSNLNQQFEAMRSNDQLASLRSAQDINWFEYRIKQDFLQALMHVPEIHANFEKYKGLIVAGQISVRSALSAMAEQLSRILSVDPNS